MTRTRQRRARSPRQREDERLLRPDQVSEQLACSVKAVYAWAARGELASVRLGRLVRFRPSDVRRFVDERIAS